MKDLEQLVLRLCEAPGVPGEESPAAKTAEKEFAKYAETRLDAMGNLIVELGNPDSETHVLLDAHLDQIGLIVTGIDKNGFLQVDRCGGTDRRVLPGSAVVVHGREPLTGVICCMPPHLTDGTEDKVEPVDKMAVDVGLSAKDAKKLIHPGDRITFFVRPRSLLGTRVTAAGLDNRASVACYVRCAQLLAGDKLDCRVTIQCSTQEEVGGAGAVTSAFSVEPTQAIVVDVSFANQPDVQPQNSGPLGGGPMIGFAPVLNREIGNHLVEIAKKKNIPYKLDIMGGSTGTNSDGVAVTRGGVRTGMISIPLKYMHTPAEIIDLRDVENTAQLIAEYLRGVK